MSGDVGLPVHARRLSANTVQVSTPILAQPNYMRVVRTSEGFLLTNGYHRAVSLLKRKITRLVCMLGSEAEEQTFCMARDFLEFDAIRRFRPKLGDFLDPQYAFKLAIRTYINIVTVQVIVTRTQQWL